MDKILIIKIGALGDVVRTTCILRTLKGEITWVTKRNAFPLLRNNGFVHHLTDIHHAHTLERNRYDLVISLDEEPMACHLASKLGKKTLIGTYSNGSRMTYTDSSAEWFDMGLISKFGKKSADEKKWKNRKSYQEIMFAMLRKKFKGEEYVLPSPHGGKKNEGGKELIGIETRSGDRWVGKRWSRYTELLDLLKERRMEYMKFRTFPTLEQFIRHVDKTDLVLTTDSLALHIALGLRKKVVSIFTCTSFHEIHGYHRMSKVISPEIEKYYYTTDTELKSGESIEPETVFKEILKLQSRKI